MNKAVLLGVLAVVIVILAAIGFVLMKKPADSNQTVPTGSGAMLDEISPDNAPSSLRELMSVTASQTCTFSDESGYNGTVYVGGGKMRGDFTTTSDDQTFATHMVTDSSTINMWFDGATEGYKISFSEIEKFTDTGEDGQKSVDLDQKVSLECSPWAVDETVFNLPNLEFKDFGALLPTSAGDGEDAKALQCGACDTLQGEAATSCRAALGC